MADHRTLFGKACHTKFYDQNRLVFECPSHLRQVQGPLCRQVPARGLVLGDELGQAQALGRRRRPAARRRRRLVVFGRSAVSGRFRERARGSDRDLRHSALPRSGKALMWCSLSHLSARPTSRYNDYSCFARCCSKCDPLSSELCAFSNIPACSHSGAPASECNLL